MEGEFVAAIIGALVGAAAGAVPAYFLARRASEETRRRDQDERFERAKAGAFEAYQLLTLIVDETFSLRSSVEEMMKKGDIPHDRPHQYALKPLAGLNLDIPGSFPPHSLQFLAGSKHGTLVANLALLARQARNLVASMSEYSALKQEVQSIASEAEGFEDHGGGRITLKLTEEQNRRLVLAEMNAEVLASAIVFDLRETTRSIPPIVDRFYTAIVEVLGDGVVPRPSLDLATREFPDINLQEEGMPAKT